jgi:proline iminopeptidase
MTVHRRFQHETGLIETPDGKIWYKASGIGSGNPVITLHGGPGFPHDYLEPLESLGRNRTVIFYDQLGCGRSDRPDNTSLWRIERFVEELETVRQELQIEKFHLLGSSWGTMLGMDYYLRYPNRVASLIFKSPCLSAKLWAEDAQKLCTEMGEDWNRIVTHHEATGTTSSEEYKNAKEQFGRKFICRLDHKPVESERSKLGFNPQVYLTMWGPAEFTATGNLKDYDRVSDLTKIRVPTLFLCGRYDEARPETVEYYQRQVPASKLVVFEQSAHVSHLEETEEFIRVVSDFLLETDKL